MKLLNDWKLVWKLSLGFFLVLLCTAVVAGVGFNGLFEIRRSVDIAEDANKILELMAECRVYQQSFETNGFVVAEEGDPTAANKFWACVPKFEDRLNLTESKLRNDKDVETLQSIRQNFITYTTTFNNYTVTRQIRDTAGDEWGLVGWSLINTIDAARQDVAEARAAAERSGDFDRFQEWANISYSLDQNIVEPTLMLRIRGLSIATNATEEVWLQFQEQYSATMASMATWSAQVRGNPELAATAEKIMGALQAYSQGAGKYRQAYILMDEQELVMTVVIEKIQQNVVDLRDAQVKAVSAIQRQSLTTSIVAFGVALVVGAAAAFVITYSIASPAAALQRVAEHLAAGDIDVSVDLDQKDEMGRLANAFRKMIAYNQHMARAADKLAVGDVAVDVAPQSKKDVLGQAVQRMVDYQQHVTAAATRMAEGDLTVEVSPQGPKDALGNAYAIMVSNIRKMVKLVQHHADEVSMAARQINAVSEQSATATGQVAVAMQHIAQGAADQTARMARTNEMVQQVSHSIAGVAQGAQEQSIAVTQASDVTLRISSSIEQVVMNAHSGAEVASHAAETAQSGAHTIEAAIEGMQSIKQAQDEARRKVTEMGGRAAEIGLIVEAIEKIADQTNLLALNAAIEAARAGEHGKGFAVVADEVRRLAENAGGATREIVALVKGIQQSVSEAVQAMEAGAVEVNAGVGHSRKAASALGEIMNAVDLVNQQMTGITDAAGHMSQAAQEMVHAVESVSAIVEENTASTEEMAASAEEVMGSIAEVAGITEENSASVEEVSASIEEVSAQAEEVTASAETLREMAEGLQALVARFKLENEAN